ncbi:hypothetical protein T439DRAFT_356780 [Meredithblackwellia eburnea MCA 4105]
MGDQEGYDKHYCRATDQFHQVRWVQKGDQRAKEWKCNQFEDQSRPCEWWSDRPVRLKHHLEKKHNKRQIESPQHQDSVTPTSLTKRLSQPLTAASVPTVERGSGESPNIGAIKAFSDPSRVGNHQSFFNHDINEDSGKDPSPGSRKTRITRLPVVSHRSRQFTKFKNLGPENYGTSFSPAPNKNNNPVCFVDDLLNPQIQRDDAHDQWSHQQSDDPVHQSWHDTSANQATAAQWGSHINTGGVSGFHPSNEYHQYSTTSTSSQAQFSSNLNHQASAASNSGAGPYGGYYDGYGGYYDGSSQSYTGAYDPEHRHYSQQQHLGLHRLGASYQRKRELALWASQRLLV